MAIKSNNPAFQRMDGFNGKSTGGNAYAGYGSPSSWSTGAGASSAAGTLDRPSTHQPVGTDGPMTIDSTVQKTGITLGILVVAAAATWLLTPAVTSESNLSSLYALSLVGALVGFGLAMVNSFKKVVSPGLVIAYAAVEGVFVGAMSKTFDAAFGNGVVVGAVVGTIAAFAGTLAAYKFFDIKVTDKFRRFVIAAGFGFMGLVVLDLVLSFFNADLGLNGFGPIGLLMSVVGLALGIFFLILDFDFVERGIQAGLPERESWRAAFGLTVTIVFIYVELLRILAILRGN